MSEEPEDSRQRRRWEKEPPERLLSLLEKARLSRAFSTFLINRGLFKKTSCVFLSNDIQIIATCGVILFADDDPLVGPLSQPQGDDPDGPELEVAVDEERLQPRSDDEDT